ncbi:MAG: phosphate ABC transporter substrate-binding protein [Candidatus Omnitrophica bacterium]|nr:phosphate ABC transporter substrate-binding protein [Candidatus Omnitrophota bacterium]MDD5081181.1 phosphate ABC transporter substrate-binding protein [Candidatus Omnitrophota bacterium]MDD5440619.1 phosphate ABC transporter substrate-binding protein [Candidatus Omnitrophota bacterium]
MKKILILLTIALMFAYTHSVSADDMLQIKGSDTLINLVQRLAERYMEKNGGKYIAVTGGGSGTGIAALINGKCDIANASRLIKSKEIEQANSVNVDPKRVVVAVDGLSVIVSKDNPIDKLTMDELGKIFRGEVTNWQEFGGKNMPITLYGRQSNSGTFDFFREVVLKGDYSPKMNRMNGNAQIVEAIKQDASGIGYVGVGYVKNANGVTVMRVASRAGADYASPLSAQDVKSGKYPIARPLNQYINGTPKGAAKDFILFELSEEGQRIVEEEGFFVLPNEYVEFNRNSMGL